MNSKAGKPFWYIAGSSFYQDEQSKKILEKMEDCETEVFNPEELASGSFYGFISSAPLFSESKAAVVKSFGAVKDKPDFIKSCANCIEATILVMAEETKIDKKLSEALASSGFNLLVEESKKQDITGKVIRMFSEAGFTIDTTAAGQINELFDGNLSMVKSEVDKLTAYFAYKKPETQSDILKAITAKRQDNIFVFIDNFTYRKRKECFALLTEFIASGENLRILINLLFKRMRDVYGMQVSKDMVKENRYFLLDRIKTGAKAWKRQELINLFSVFAELDYMVKTGQTNDEAYLTRLIGLL
jgi:DNA polymerase-3 subunit delta